jgi:hypothetical protein
MVRVKGGGQSDGTNSRGDLFQFEFYSSLDSKNIGRDELKLFLFWVNMDGGVLILMKRCFGDKGTTSGQDAQKQDNRKPR